MNGYSWIDRAKRPEGRRPVGVAVGHVTHDRFGGGSGRLRPGGCAYYAAKVWSALGADPGVVTSVGRDFLFSEGLSGIRVAGRGGELTTSFENRYPQGGPRAQWVSARAPRVEVSWVDRSFLRADMLFLAPVLGEVNPARWLWKARPRVDLVGLGLQGFVKRAAYRKEAGSGGGGWAEVVSRTWKPDLCVLRWLDVIFLSDEDLMGHPPELLHLLRRHVPLVVMTLGTGGCRLMMGPATAQVGVYETDRVKDPTGAGDTFASAFMLAVKWGAKPVEAARFGAAAASVIIEEEGDGACARLGQAFERYEHVPVISASPPLRDRRLARRNLLTKTG